MAEVADSGVMKGYKPCGRHPDKRLTAIAVKRLGPGRYADGNGLYLEGDDSGAARGGSDQVQGDASTLIRITDGQRYLLRLKAGTAKLQGPAVFFNDPAHVFVDAPGKIDVDFQPQVDAGTR